MTNSIKKLQKLTLLLFLAIFTAGLTSCDKDDDKDADKNELQTNSSIVGTWYYDAGDGDYGTIYFGANGRGMFDGEDAFSYSIDGNMLRMTFSDEEGTYTESFSIVKLSGDTLILGNSMGDTITCHRM